MTSTFKPKKGTSWQDKLHKPQKSEIKEGPEPWNKKHGGSKMLISTPKEIQAIVETIPQGQIMLISDLRKTLANIHHADYTCPLTTGIFLRIVAEAAEEIHEPSNKTPWWRIVGEKGLLNPKLPGGGELQAALLEKEGLIVFTHGKNKYVKIF